MDPKMPLSPEAKRFVDIETLRHLMSFPRLGGWGMDALITTLNDLIPEFQKDPLAHPPVRVPSTFVE